jgi:hypothetical protein
MAGGMIYNDFFADGDRLLVLRFDIIGFILFENRLLSLSLTIYIIVLKKNTKSID